jgi:hypothetical protein
MTNNKYMDKNGKLTKLISEYGCGWVSISKEEDKVLAWGKTLDILSKKLKDLNYPEGILLKICKDYSSYVG